MVIGSITMGIYPANTQIPVSQLNPFAAAALAGLAAPNFGVAATDVYKRQLIPRLHNDQLRALRSVLLANNDVVMKEMERRGPPV